MFYLAATHTEHDLEDALAWISRYTLLILDGATTAHAWSERWERNRAQVLGPLATAGTHILACRIDTIDVLRYICVTRPNFSAQDATVLEYLLDSLRSKQQTYATDEAEYGTILAKDEAVRKPSAEPTRGRRSEDSKGLVGPALPGDRGAELVMGDGLGVMVVDVYADGTWVSAGPCARDPVDGSAESHVTSTAPA